jgi:hypothetical protein
MLEAQTEIRQHIGLRLVGQETPRKKRRAPPGIEVVDLTGRAPANDLSLASSPTQGIPPTSTSPPPLDSPEPSAPLPAE